MTEPRTAIVAGLHELADAIEANPALPIPYHLDTARPTRRLLLFARTAPEVEAAAWFLSNNTRSARQVLLPRPATIETDPTVKIDVDLVGLTIRLFLTEAHVDPELVLLLPVEDLRTAEERHPSHDPDRATIAELEASLAGTTTTGAVEADVDDPELLRTVETPFSLDDALGDVSGEDEELDDHDLDELAIMVRAKVDAGTFSDQETVELGLGSFDEEGDIVLNRAGLAVAKRLLPIELRRDLDEVE